MRGLATFQIHGRATQEPELDFLSNGTERCHVNVAVNTPYQDDNKKWVEVVTFFRLTWFGVTAKRVASSIVKGNVLLVTGDIRSYDREIDGKRYTFYNMKPKFLSVMDVVKGEPRSESAPSRAEQEPERPRERPPQAEKKPDPVAQEMATGNPFIDDDIPF